MNDVSDLPADAAPLGLLLGLISAALYTCTNICLRAVVHCDDVWVSCLKAVPTMLLAATLVLVDWRRGRAVGVPAGTVLALFATAMLAHWGGNVVFQFGLREIGLAYVVPLTFGALILSGAVLGRVCLGEVVTPRAAVAMFVLIAAIALLSLGAGSAVEAAEPHFDPTPHGRFGLALGVAAAIFSGLAYAVMGVVMRRMAVRRVPISVVLLVISVTGVVTLGLGGMARVGWEGLVSSGSADIAAMLGAGAFNAVAFLMLGKALELAPLAQVNSINASQTAMAAVAGILFFREQPTWILAIGLSLTVLGLVLVARKGQRGNQNQE